MDSSIVTKRQRHLTMRTELMNERSTFDPLWRDCAQYVLPNGARFSLSEHNRGERRNQSIIDGTATDALYTLSAGMMAGITSPARPWFRLSTPDPDLAEFGAVKEWSHAVTERKRSMFLKTNLYKTFPGVYHQLGAFGTSAFAVEDDEEDVLRFRAFPTGSYCLAVDPRGRVNTFYREYRYTVRQLITEFGRNDEKGRPDWSIFSEHVKSLWDNSNYNALIDMAHIIEPNEEWEPNYFDSKYKKFSSCHFELGSGSAKYDVKTDQRYVREKGYDLFPILAPRWMVTAEDVYATSWPMLDSLGDTKQLQLGEKRKMQAIEKMVNPPMVADGNLRQQGSSVLPGGVTYLPGAQSRFEPAYQVDPRINELEMTQEACRFRIRRFFKADLFLAVTNSQDRQRTAREIEERSQEKLLVIGPVLEHLNQDVLDPLIEIAFDAMVRRGMIPPPPRELEEKEMKVEYISVMHQAQKSVGIAALERFRVGVTMTAAETQNPALLDKVDFDEWVDDFGDACGVSPKIVRSDEKTAEIRKSRADAETQQAQVEQAAQAAGAARDLASADMSGDNALTGLMRMANAGNPLQGVA